MAGNASRGYGEVKPQGLAAGSDDPQTSRCSRRGYCAPHYCQIRACSVDHQAGPGTHDHIGCVGSWRGERVADP